MELGDGLSCLNSKNLARSPPVAHAPGQQSVTDSGHDSRSGSQGPASTGSEQLLTDEELLCNFKEKSVQKKRSGQLEAALQMLQRGDDASHYVALVRGRMCHLALSSVGWKLLAALFPKLPAAQASDLAQELLGQVVFLSEHKFGIRAMSAVLAAQLQQSDVDEVTSQLVSEALDSVDELIYSVFGHRLLLVLLENGSSDLRSRVVQQVNSHRHGLLVVCFNQDACNVVKMVMKLASEDELSMMARELMADGVECLTTFVYSLPVLAALLRRRSVMKDVVAKLREDPGSLRSSKRGRSLAKHYNI